MTFTIFAGIDDYDLCVLKHIINMRQNNKKKKKRKEAIYSHYNNHNCPSE